MDATRGSTEADATDIALVRQLATGDRGALQALYGRHAAVLLGLAVRILGSRAEAEDLLHDVFLEAWKRCDSYDPARGSVRTWLAVRTRSRALDRKKSPRLARAVAFDEAAERNRPAPELDVGLAMTRKTVRAAIQSLPADVQQLLELAYFDGMSTAQIAEQLACPQGTVKSRMSAARARLKEALDARGGAP